MIKKDIFLSNPNIGLFVSNNNNIAIAGILKEAFIREIEEVLKVKVYRNKIFGTNLIGIFVLMNDNYIFIPDSVDLSDEELEKFKSVCENNDLELVFVESKKNALSNVVILINNKALIEESLKSDNKMVNNFKDRLEEVDFFKVEGVESIGQLIISDGNNALASNLLNEEDINFLKDFFKLREIKVGTINFGNSFLKSGVLINKNGILVGKDTTGIELLNLTEVFPYLK